MYDVNEIRIAEVRDSARKLQLALVKKFNEVDLSEEKKEGIVKEYKKLEDLYLMKDIPNVDSYENKFKRIKNRVSKEYGVHIPVELPLSARINEDNKGPVLVNSVERPNEEIEKKKDNSGWLLATTMVGITMLLTGLGLGSCNNEKKVDGNRLVVDETVEGSENDLVLIVDETPAASRQDAEENTTTETKVEETEVKEEMDQITEPTESETVVAAVDTVLGEYGTFLDASDNEQVEARARYIFDNYYAPIMEYIKDDSDIKVVTVENIANAIRVLNGELPLDSEGNVEMNGNVAQTNEVNFDTLVANIPSQANNGVTYFVPAHLFAVDGSEESEFIKSYDVIYQKIANGLNINDDEEVQDGIACLGYKFYNEWYLQGMRVGVNPHIMTQHLKDLMAHATIAPYGTSAFESNINQKRPVCIDVCIDYETGETRTLTVDQIFLALLTGNWNLMVERTTGTDVENISWFEQFRDVLNDELNWKYDHLYTLRLN